MPIGLGPDPDAIITSGYRYAFTLARSTEQAEDLTHDAWLRCQRRWLRPNRSYLFKAIKHLWIDQCRRTHGHLEVIESLGAEAPDDAERLMLALEDREKLEDALMTLSGAEREVLFLAVVEQWTAKEVAQHLGESRNTVLSRIHRAKARLKKTLTAGRRRTRHAKE